MNNFTFYSPTCFAFGRDSEKQAGALVRRFGGSRVLIHYGGGSAVRSGLLGRVQESLAEEGEERRLQVAEDPWEEVARALIRGLYYQRCGCALPREFFPSAPCRRSRDGRLLLFSE